jgi:integrase
MRLRHAPLCPRRWLQTIRDLLGHSSIGVTSAIYVDVLREVQHDAVDRISHLFGPDGEVGTAP